MEAEGRGERGEGRATCLGIGLSGDVAYTVHTPYIQYKRWGKRKRIEGYGTCTPYNEYNIL